MAREQGSPKTATALATAVGFDANALRKSPGPETARKMLIEAGPILRHVAAMGYIVETGHDEYNPDNFSAALTLPVIGHPYPL